MGAYMKLKIIAIDGYLVPHNWCVVDTETGKVVGGIQSAEVIADVSKQRFEAIVTLVDFELDTQLENHKS